MTNSLENVFITTPDTFENRVNDNFDEAWCRDCMAEDGRQTVGQKLHKLNEQRKHEKTQ